MEGNGWVRYDDEALKMLQTSQTIMMMMEQQRKKDDEGDTGRRAEVRIKEEEAMLIILRII